jgi:hypothetical protein
VEVILHMCHAWAWVDEARSSGDEFVASPNSLLCCFLLCLPTAVRAGKVDAEAVESTRDTWQFEDFSTESEYRQMAEQAGLVVKTSFDWTASVLGANSLILRTLRPLARSKAGRAALRAIFPEVHLTEDEWAEWVRVTTHQLACLQHVRYMALVLEHEKPISVPQTAGGLLLGVLCRSQPVV